MIKTWQLEGKKALVTGGSRGIGKAIVNSFLDLGAEVWAIGRSKENVEALLQSVQSNRLKASSYDLSIASERISLFEEIKSNWSNFDILVNNVGTNVRKPTLEFDTTDMDLIWQTNTISSWDICRFSYPFMKNQGGSIINISSVSSEKIIRTSTAAYAMTKAALDQMTRFLAVEWGPDQIRVNAIQPWYIDTDLVASVLNDPQKKENIINKTPLGRVGQADEVASLASFLAMSQSSYITGTTIPVDGGFHSLGL